MRSWYALSSFGKLATGGAWLWFTPSLWAQQTTCQGSCTITFVLDGSGIPLLNLDTQAGAEISIAIVGVWAVALGFRALIRMLSVDGNSNHESESS